MVSTVRHSEVGRCPSDERLLAYLLAASPSLGDGRAADDGVHATVAAHVATCDRCVVQLRSAHARLQLDESADAPVPSRVAARVAPPRPRRFAAWMEWLREAVPMPVLVPVAAVLAVFVFAGVPDRPAGVEPEERTRDVTLRQPARVTAAAAIVRRSPESGSESLAELARGDGVLLMGERGGWYQVELDDGTAGWMPRTAFE